MNYPKSKGIIQKLNNISPEEIKKIFFDYWQSFELF